MQDNFGRFISCGSDRLGEERLNNKGCQMRIVEYNTANDIVVEFQDNYSAKVHTSYQMFKTGRVKNPYYPNVFGVGIPGNKYLTKYTGDVYTREYSLWHGILARCFSENARKANKNLSYRDVKCCDEWLLYDNFFEWLHAQTNFDKWDCGDKWCIDKDILIKGNRIYSPETCCLVPSRVNILFIKRNATRGDSPIGVHKNGNKYIARCRDTLASKLIHLGTYSTPEEAFYAYKKYKEDLIKRVAQIEFNAGNIIEECYNAMLRYEVEITD